MLMLCCNFKSSFFLFSTSGTNSVFLVTPFLGMAKALGSIGKATKAIEFYHRAITILESSRGAESEDLVIPLFGLGSLLLQEGKAKDAETAFLRLNLFLFLFFFFFNGLLFLLLY